DTFATGFQVLQQFLTADQTRSMFLRGAKILRDRCNLLAQFLRLLAALVHLGLLSTDRYGDSVHLLLKLNASRLQRIALFDDNAPAIAKANLLGRNVFPFNLDRCDSAVYA